MFNASMTTRPKAAPPSPWTVSTATPTMASAVQPPIINYPTTAQQTALNVNALSGAWGNWFAQVFGPIANYYTPERGGVQQAQYDSRNWATLFQQMSGRPATTEDIPTVFNGYRQWALANNQQVSLAGLMEFTRQTMMWRPRPNPLSYVRPGEI